MPPRPGAPGQVGPLSRRFITLDSGRDDVFLWHDIWQAITSHLAAGQAVRNVAEILVYLAMVVLFVIGILKCIVPVSQCRRQLNKGARRIRRNDSKETWQDKKFLGRGPLTTPWSEYLNSRLFADDEYYDASPIDDYINEDTAIYDPGFSSFADALPGILVSLGFLGTLIGIIMGLSNFNLDNANATMSAIRVLMDGMRYAFATSIVGVIGSISFSLILRTVQGSARKALQAFYDAMSTKAHMSTVDPITQIAIYQQEQTQMIHALAQDVAGDLTDRIGTTVGLALQPLQDSLDNFVTVAAREQIRGLDIIVNKFVENMNASLQGQFVNLATMIDKTCQWHQDTQETVRATIDGLNRVSRDIVQIEQMSESLIARFDGYIGRLGTAQQRVEEGYASVSDNIRSMEAVARQLSGYIAQIGQMQADFVREVDSFQTRMDAFTQAYTESGSLSTAALQKVAEEVRQSGEALQESHKAFTHDVNKDLQHAFGMFDQNMQDIIDDLTNLMEGIRAAVKDMPGIMGDAATQFARQTGQLVTYMEQTSQALEDATRRLSRGGGQ